MATTCNTFCITRACKERKACACNCQNWFGGTNQTLVKACEGKCWVDPSFYKKTTKEGYMCSELGAQEMYNRHGHLCPGFDPLSSTAQGQAYKNQQDQINQGGESRKTILFAGGMILLILLAALYL